MDTQESTTSIDRPIKGGDFLLGILNEIIRFLNWKFLPHMISIGVFIISFIVLLGWYFSIPMFKSVIADSIGMKANTAVGFILSSIALFLIGGGFTKTKKIISFVLALAVSIIGLASISQNIFGLELGIDQLLFVDLGDKYTKYPGRLAPFTSIAFVFIGLALMSISFNYFKKQAQMISIVIAIIGFLILLGYLWNASQLIDFKLSTPVAMNTALCIALLGIGVYLASFEPDRPRFIVAPIEIKIISSFIISFMLLLIGSGYTYHTVSEYTVSIRRVAHSQEAKTLLSQIYSSTLEIESIQRSYLASAIESQKTDYEKGVAALNENCKKLSNIFVDNPDQIKNTEKLIKIISSRIDTLNSQILLFENNSNKPENYGNTKNAELEMMVNLRKQVKAIAESENELLQIREQTMSNYRDNTLIAIVLTLTLAMLLYTIIFKTIREEIIARTKAENIMNQEKENAEQANRSKNSFLAIMSHEIRTPLTGMLGMMELLSMTKLEDDQIATLNTAWDSGRSLLRIVSDILDWSKIEEGKLELSPSPTSISQLLQEVVNTYSRVASSKDLMLWQHTDSRISSSHEVDSLRLSQVLNNFVSNAIKFTKNGEIEIRAVLCGKFEGKERIKFSVKDTGIGIDKDVQLQLFQFYRQESAQTARLYGGTGLGLAICKRLTELMDGVIELESEFGVGSTFSITLTLPITKEPLTAIQKQHADVKQRMIIPLYADKMKAPFVLAVDDHPTNRDMLAKQLSLLGLQIESAENGYVALNLWKSGKFSLIISDCNMPELNGYELSRSIRKIEIEKSLQKTIIIAWTANALQEEKMKCINSGMDDVLIKPVDLENLKRMLAKWLGIPVNDYSNGHTHNVSPINYSILSKSIREPSKQIEILQFFCIHIRNDFEKLIEYIVNSDRNNVENISHRMKGSSLMVGANDIAIICEIIENKSNANDLHEAIAEIPKLKEAIILIEKYCSSLKHT